MDSSSTAIIVRSGPEKDAYYDGEGETKRRKKEFTAEDLIIEILARLPVKTLSRFRCVSKYWYNLILSPNLISMHSTYSHSNNKNVTLRAQVSRLGVMGTEVKVTFRFGEDDDPVQDLTFNYSNMKLSRCLKIVGCFNGVVCISISPSPQTYALCNPATRQVREIGESPMEGPIPSVPFYSESYCSGFCFDPMTNSFKVAQIQLIGEEAGETRAQVNVFSTDTNPGQRRT